MCTVSWCFEAHKLHVLVNRDEQNNRAPASGPELFKAQGISAGMPIDPQGGGSWTAFNDKGFVFCLLNNYQHQDQTQTDNTSRGLLIKNLAHCANWDAINQRLEPRALTTYRPFILLIFDRFHEPVQFNWDGKQLRHTLAPRSPVSSSSLAPRWTPWLRRTWARLKLPANAGLEALKKLHASRGILGSAFGVAMQRSKTQTVSVSHIAIGKDSGSIHYWPGYPETLSEDVGEDLTLKLASSSQPASRVSRVSSKTLLDTYQPQLAQSFGPVKWATLRWCIAEKRLNKLLQKLDSVPPDRLADKALQLLGVEPELQAMRWPDAHTRPVFICNHPTGGVDGLIVIAALQKRYPNLRVIANDALLTLSHLQDLIVPVSVFEARKASTATVTQAFAGKAPLLVFPAGKTARYSVHGELDDGAWAKSIATLSRRYRRSLVPMFIQSRNSSLFYCIHKMRNLLGVRLNLEMLLLPRETLKPYTQRPQLFIDVPMQPSELQACGVNDQQRMQWCKARSYALSRHFNEVNHDIRRPPCSRRAKPRPSA